MLTTIRTFFTSILLAAALPAAPILYTISANTNGTPNQLVKIDVANSTVTPFSTIGNGTQSYGGGLYTSTGVSFMTFQAAGNGQTNFLIMDAFGSPFASESFPEFRGGGIAVTAPVQNIVWIQNDAQGVSQGAINGTILATLGDNLIGGLAYRDTNQRLYTIRTDPQGASSFRYIDPNTISTVALPIAMGTGFTGGLAWDPTDDLFYAIASDANNNATLYRFGLNDAAPTALFGLGQGFTYASLTAIPSPSSVPNTSDTPEPATFLMLGAGLMIIGLTTRSRN